MSTNLNNPTEIWKPIKNFEGLYEISNLGRVKSLARRYPSVDIIRKLTYTHNGYLQTTLHKDGKTYGARIAGLVASAFIPNPDNKPQVNHKNGIKTDNRVENLEWCTMSENHYHAYKTNLKRQLKGSDNPRSYKIAQYDLNGNFIKEYGSIREAARENNFSMGNIQQVCAGVYEQRYGYKWSIIE